MTVTMAPGRLTQEMIDEQAQKLQTLFDAWRAQSRTELLADIEDVEDRIEALKDRHAALLTKLAQLDAIGKGEPR
jgi:hypothetical protein